MRRGLAVTLIGLMAIAPIFVFHPLPGPPEIAPEDQPAQHLTTYRWQEDADWFGGFSGIETTPDGQGFFAVTDRGHLTRGSLQRQQDRIVGVSLDAAKPMPDRFGQLREHPLTDAEGLALDTSGRLYVSFEFADRIIRYNSWDSLAEWPSYTRAWRALGANAGLELVAVDDAGTLFSIPEGIARGGVEALVYRRHPQQQWEQPFTLPLDSGFLPVGGDFGPDGRFYLLERSFVWFGFRNRVRRMSVTDGGFEEIEILLETPHRRHGNVEGLAVWAAPDGSTRLTMISDDNFLPILRTEIIEYTLQE